MVARWKLKSRSFGSNPSYKFSSVFALVTQLAEYLICNQAVAGSIPVEGSNFNLKFNMSKKHVIEIQAPDGKIPVYDEASQTIKFINADVKDRVHTVDDAYKVLGIQRPNWSCDIPMSTRYMHDLQTVLAALNEGHKFSLTEGRVWYPWVRFYLKSKLPDSEKDNVIGKFICDGKSYCLLGGLAGNGGFAGLGCFDSHSGVGFSGTTVGFLSCKDEETALHVCKYFGKLIFDAFYSDKIEYDFTWIA